MTDSDLRLKKGIKLNLILLFSAFTFYFLVYYLVNKYSSTRNISYYFIISGFTLLDMILLIDFYENFRKSITKILSVSLLSALVIFLLYLFTDDLFKINILADHVFFRRIIFAVYFLISLILFINYLITFIKIEKITDNKKEYDSESILIKNNTFKAALLYCAAVLFIYSPASIYMTSPDDFIISIFILLISGVAVSVVFYSVVIFIYKIAPNALKTVFTYFFVFLSLLVFFNTFIIPGQYGSLNNLILSDAEKLYGSVFVFVKEFAIITFSYILTVFLITKAGKKIVFILFLINFVAFTQTGIGLISIKSNDKQNTETVVNTDNNFLPSYNDELMSFSKDGKNIVVLFLDMFSGGYVQDIFKERPDLKAVYDGFTWYPNTLSISYVTSSSVPAMNAGWKYTPDEINKRNENVPLTDVIGDTYKILPDLLKKHNFKSAYLDPDYCYTYRGDVDRLADAGIIAGFNKDYMGYWKNKNSIKNFDKINNGGNKFFEIKLLGMISFFKASPAVLRPVIYDEGNWLIVSSNEKKNSAYNSKLKYWSFYDSLEDISNTDSKKNTFKYLHTCITHDPFSLSGDGELIKGYPDPVAGDNFHGKNAYLSAKGALVRLSGWIEWLKENGIYNNTKIIIAADHGDDFSESPMMPEDFEVEGITDKDFTRLHVALIVKDFGSHGELKEDWRLMSNADIPSIIVSDYSDIKDFGSDPSKSDIQEGRIVKTMKADSWKWHYISNHDKFRFEYFYEVKDNIFKSENWSKK